MTMPLDIVLVRHGESEGNYAYGLSHKGDHRYFLPDAPFLQRHGSRWRLTHQGRQQAEVTGAWLRTQVAPAFDRYYASEYLRAMETWRPPRLCGRPLVLRVLPARAGLGQVRCDAIEQRKREYADDLRRRELDRFFWTPPMASRWRRCACASIGCCTRCTANAPTSASCSSATAR